MWCGTDERGSVGEFNSCRLEAYPGSFYCTAERWMFATEGMPQELSRFMPGSLAFAYFLRAQYVLDPRASVMN